MNLESQVTSLDLAKRLKELGVKQESLWYWVFSKDPFNRWIVEPDLFYGDKPTERYSAFTVAELGEMLPGLLSCSSPDYASEGKRQWELFCGKDESPFVGYFNGSLGSNGNFGFLKYADTEADARAKMLCYLLENGLLQLPGA